MSAGWLTVKEEVQVAPGSMVEWGPPSMLAGRRSPWQWTAVVSGSSLVNSRSTGWFLDAWMVGPSMAPLNPQVAVLIPGRISVSPVWAMSL